MFSFVKHKVIEIKEGKKNFFNEVKWERIVNHSKIIIYLYIE